MIQVWLFPSIFETMHLTSVPRILIENKSIESKFLRRQVPFDCYLPHPVEDPSDLSLLLINDGQNMEEVGLASILQELYDTGSIHPILCVAIHASELRKMEYGVASTPDYLGRGGKARLYTSFIMEELLPYIHHAYKVPAFKDISFAGFSLGGLSAIDIVWNHPKVFTRAGVFSGSLWWRSVAQEEEEYDDHLHRIMHQEIRKGEFHPGLKFFFQCGNKDETKDRNHNGIIDSVDDTLDLVRELVAKGYDPEKDIAYLEMPDGRHDMPTWGLAMPAFLQWGYEVKRGKE